MKKFVPLLLCFVLLSGLMLSGCEPEVRFVPQTVIQTVTGPTQTVTLTQTVTVTENPSTNITTTNNSISAIKSTYETFLTYEKYKQWDKMWDMLHPDSQTLFGSKAYFIEYETEANSDVSIKSFEIGNIEIISTWNFDVIDKVYNNVAEIQQSIVVSSIFGDVENSKIVHSVLYNNNWCFFWSPK